MRYGNARRACRGTKAEWGYRGGTPISYVDSVSSTFKKYSIDEAESMLKSYSAKMMFEIHPGFRKRYPRSGFWSGYEHHESTGLIDLDKSIAYCRSQQQRHSVIVVDDRQQRLPGFAAE